jgi:hypothetical protein
MFRSLDALDWLTALTPYIPNQGEQIDRYYDYNCKRLPGLRQKENQDALIPFQSIKILYGFIF